MTTRVLFAAAVLLLSLDVSNAQELPGRESCLSAEEEVLVDASGVGGVMEFGDDWVHFVCIRSDEVDPAGLTVTLGDEAWAMMVLANVGGQDRFVEVGLQPTAAEAETDGAHTLHVEFVELGGAVEMDPGLHGGCWVLPGKVYRICYSYFETSDGRWIVIVTVWKKVGTRWVKLWGYDSGYHPLGDFSEPGSDAPPVTMIEAFARIPEEILALSANPAVSEFFATHSLDEEWAAIAEEFSLVEESSRDGGD